MNTDNNDDDEQCRLMTLEGSAYAIGQDPLHGSRRQRHLEGSSAAASIQKSDAVDDLNDLDPHLLETIILQLLATLQVPLPGKTIARTIVTKRFGRTKLNKQEAAPVNRILSQLCKNGLVSGIIINNKRCYSCICIGL